MPQPTLIVDGYNLLHASGLARQSYGPGGLERARERLLTELASWLDESQRRRTVVVFDARGSFHTYRATQHRHGMRIEFPARSREADDRIEDLIRENTAPRSLTVVSGDRRLQRAIERRRGQYESGPQFFRRLRSEAEHQPPEADKPDPTPPTEREIAQWTVWINGSGETDTNRR